VIVLGRDRQRRRQTEGRVPRQADGTGIDPGGLAAPVRAPARVFVIRAENRRFEAIRVGVVVERLAVHDDLTDRPVRFARIVVVRRVLARRVRVLVAPARNRLPPLEGGDAGVVQRRGEHRIEGRVGALFSGRRHLRAFARGLNVATVAEGVVKQIGQRDRARRQPPPGQIVGEGGEGGPHGGGRLRFRGGLRRLRFGRDDLDLDGLGLGRDDPHLDLRGPFANRGLAAVANRRGAGLRAADGQREKSENGERRHATSPMGGEIRAGRERSRRRWVTRGGCHVVNPINQDSNLKHLYFGEKPHSRLRIAENDHPRAKRMSRSNKSESCCNCAECGRVLSRRARLNDGLTRRTVARAFERVSFSSVFPSRRTPWRDARPRSRIPGRTPSGTGRCRRNAGRRAAPGRRRRPEPPWP